MIADDLIGAVPDELAGPDREARLVKALVEMTAMHCRACPPYARIVGATNPDWERAASLAELPFLPVALFKSHRLASIPDDAVTSVLTSSGTTGRPASRILVDARTAERQALALAHIVGGVVGPKRLPMLVIDTRSVAADSGNLSARGAGVMGLMRFGRHHCFALNDDLTPDIGAIRAFVDRFGGEPFLIFGFTFVVWQYFHLALADRFDLSNGILLHSGGWKRMEENAVDNRTFRRALADRFGLSAIRNFYGMVEQLGGIFMEGEDGRLHPPPFGAALVRDVETFQPAAPGQVGLIQVFSLVPYAYPGHSLLTEDIGVMTGNGGLSVLGRAPAAELRGCSDAVDYGARP